MKASDDESRKQKLPRKEVHLDLPPLLAAIINDAVEADWRCFGRSRGINLACGRWIAAVAEFGVANFMGNQKCPFERRAGVLVEDEAVPRNVYSAPAIEDGGALGGNLDIKAPTFRLGSREHVGVPRIAPIRDGLLVQPRCGMSREFDRIHVNRIRLKGARAYRRVRRRQLEGART